MPALLIRMSMWPSLSLTDARNRLDLFDLCHVQRVRLDLRLGGLHDVARRIGEHQLPPRADQDLHALPRERACRLKANSLAPTSDESRLVRKPEFHRLGSFQRSNRFVTIKPSAGLSKFPGLSRRSPRRRSLHGFSDLFRRHQGREVGVGTRHHREDRGVDHAQTLHPLYAALRIDNRHRIVRPAHAA